MSTQALRATLAALAFVASAACGPGASNSQRDIASDPAPPTASPSAERSRPAPAPSESSTEPTADAAHNAEARPAKVAPKGHSPARVVIPRIDVNAPVIDLGLADDGTLEVPQDYDDTGWYTEGPEPGARGPAVIAGHVDSKTGPAVFYRLDELTRGDTIRVIGDDGTVTEFTVDRLKRFPKTEFPTLDVYGLTPGPQLRLITCGGSFDQSTGHYRDNTVVYASLTSRS